MSARMFRKTQFDCSRKFLCSFFAVLVHVPASLDKPILKLIEGNFPKKVTDKSLTNLVLSDHFALIPSLL